MNHSDIKQTLRYAKLAPDSGKNDVQRLYRWEDYWLKQQQKSKIKSPI